MALQLVSPIADMAMVATIDKQLTYCCDRWKLVISKLAHDGDVSIGVELC